MWGFNVVRPVGKSESRPFDEGSVDPACLPAPNQLGGDLFVIRRCHGSISCSRTNLACTELPHGAITVFPKAWRPDSITKDA
jgi:hypothetical protein